MFELTEEEWEEVKILILKKYEQVYGEKENFFYVTYKSKFIRFFAYEGKIEAPDVLVIKTSTKIGNLLKELT